MNNLTMKQPNDPFSVLEKLIIDGDFDIVLNTLDIFTNNFDNDILLSILKKIINDSNWKVRKKVLDIFNNKFDNNKLLLILDDKLNNDK